MPVFQGTDGDDTYYGDALLADYVWVGGGNDNINTYGGNDNVVSVSGSNHISLGDGHDTVLSGSGSDILWGGSGNDLITGGVGVDLMYGDAGADRFIFTALADAPMSGLDRVMDFAKGSDKIDLSLIDAVSTLAGNDAFHFNAARPFFASAGDLNITTNLLGTVVEGDVNGDGLSDFRILVVGNYAMEASDFIL